MKTKILVGLLLAGSTLFAAPRIGFGINIGVPAPVVVAPPVVAAVPPCPGPGYEFINGYWQFVGGPAIVVGHGYRPAPVRVEHFDGRAGHFRR